MSSQCSVFKGLIEIRYFSNFAKNIDDDNENIQYINVFIKMTWVYYIHTIDTYITSSQYWLTGHSNNTDTTKPISNSTHDTFV